MSENEKKIRDIAEGYAVRSANLVADWVVDGVMSYEDLERILNGLFEDALTDLMFDFMDGK